MTKETDGPSGFRRGFLAAGATGTGLDTGVQSWEEYVARLQRRW